MKKEVFEDMQPSAAGGAKAKLEKQARQLAYDTKYKVKQALAAKSGGKADPATVSKMYMAQLSKSPAPPAVKALAKKKLLGEEYVDVREFAVESVSSAILKVFVENKEEVIEEEEKKTKSGETKFHIKVTDKKTGNSYHRYATRAKIAELRANPNIATVEMSHQGEAGTKKARKDYDGDGKVESSSKEHAGAVHNAIQRKKGGVPDGKDTRKEEVEVIDEDSRRTSNKQQTKRVRSNIKAFGSNYTPPNNWDPDANRGKGEVVTRKQMEKKRRKSLRQEEVEVVDESGYFPTPESQRADEKKYNLSRDELPGRHKPQQKPTPQISRPQQLNQSHKLSGELLEAEESKIGGGNLKKLAAKATKRIDADVDGDVDTNDPKETEMGEFIPSPDGKKKIKPIVQKEDYLSDWRSELLETKDEDDEKQIDILKKKKNKVKIMPDLGEECGVCDKCGKSPCECSKKEGEEDPRGMKTKANLVRNKLRAMGLKMSHVPEGELIEAKNEKDEKDEREKEQKTVEKGQKQTLKNIKKITGKKQRLDKEKYNLQRKGELPLNMSNELEGEQIDEGIPLALGAGAIAGGLALWKAYQGAKTVKKIKDDANSGKGQFGAIKKAADARSKLYQQNNSFEPEGEIVEGRALGTANKKSSDTNPKGSNLRASSGRGGTFTKAGGLGKKKTFKNNPDGDDMVKSMYDKQAKDDRREAARQRAAEKKVVRIVKNSYEAEGEMVSEMDLKKLKNPGAALGRAIDRVFVPPVADGTLKGKPNTKKVTEERKPEVEAQGKKVAGYEKEGKYQGITSKFRKENPGSRQKPKARGRKPTEGELTQSRIQKHNQRVAKHGFTSKEKKESKARTKYDSPRD